MSNLFPRLVLAVCLAAPVGFSAAPSYAGSAAPIAADDSAADSQADAQRKLTEKDVSAFLQASKTVEPIVSALPEDKRDDPDAAMLAQLEKAAKAAGLKGYADYDEIAANVAFVLQGFDTQKKTYVGQKAVLEAQIDRVKADKEMSKREKAETLKELRDDLEDVDDVQYPENIAVVTKHYDELSAILQP